MATVLAAVIKPALWALGQLPAGKDPSSAEQADALVVLNRLLDRWRNRRLIVYALQEETVTLTSGAASKTIGPSGDLTTTRPVAIEGAWIVDNGISYPVKPMTEEQYDAIPIKALSADWPTHFLYRGTYANGTLITYPVANATRSMKIVTRVVMSAFSAVSDSLAVPPGYEDLLVNGLAIALGPMYGTSASQDVRRAYAAALDGIQTVYGEPVRANSGLLELIGPSGSPDINTLDT